MKVVRALVPLFVLGLFACSLPTPGVADDASSATDNGPQQWIPVPVSQDASAPPPSIKVPPRTTTPPGAGKDSGVSDVPPDDTWYGGLTSDIDDPAIAPVCADRDAQKGTYAFATPYAHDLSDSSIAITRDLTEHRYGDGIYRTDFSLRFRTAAQKIDDRVHGRTRVEGSWSLNLHLASAVSQPDAFTEGAPTAVEVGIGELSGNSCSEDGAMWGGYDSEDLPYEKGIIIITKRTNTGVAGTLDFGDQHLTFDAPFGESYFGEDGLCCLE